MSKSLYRSELGNTAKIKLLLNKIKSMHIQIQKGSALYDSRSLASLAIDESLSVGTLVFTPAGPAAAAASAAKQDLTYTADGLGTGGNAITVTYTAGGTAGSELVSVVGSAISVQIASGVSTATQVKAAVDAFPAAAALVNITISGTGSNAQVAQSATSLAGGVSAQVAQTYDYADIRCIRRRRTRKWTIELFDNANAA